MLLAGDLYSQRFCVEVKHGARQRDGTFAKTKRSMVIAMGGGAKGNR